VLRWTKASPFPRRNRFDLLYRYCDAGGSNWGYELERSWSSRDRMELPEYDPMTPEALQYIRTARPSVRG